MKRPPEERMERFIDRSAGDGCWLWTGSINPDGYGQFDWAGAHRAVYRKYRGPIPSGLQLDHMCHNADLTCPGGRSCMHRRCVNPDHLEPATTAENTGRAGWARRTHCGNGHPFEGTNLATRADGFRKCRQCHREYMRQYRKLKTK